MDLVLDLQMNVKMIDFLTGLIEQYLELDQELNAWLILEWVKSCWI